METLPRQMFAYFCLFFLTALAVLFSGNYSLGHTRKLGYFYIWSTMLLSTNTNSVFIGSVDQMFFAHGI